MNFQPDYHNVIMAAQNKTPSRIPLYDHGVHVDIMEKILGVDFACLYHGNRSDKEEYYKKICEFYRKMGYDTVSFERCAGPAMPGSGALGNHTEGIIKTMEDYNAYPWEKIPALYFEKYAADFEAMQKALPEGMKAIGGVGNGVFECVQDVVGYMDLCYLRIDEPELFEKLFQRVGDMLVEIWSRMLAQYGDTFCVCRFGDDLGFKSATLLAEEDIKRLIVPQYKRIIALVHAAGKPFLLHSCGCIFNVMDDIIEAGIDAKHSNEDAIAPFSVWVERYGDRIGNFGGIDTDAVCRLNPQEMQEYIENVFACAKNHGGFAFGTGNSVPDYVPVENYLLMNRIARTLRGEEL